MNHDDNLRVTIEEFSRLQDYMSAAEKDSEVYRKMKKRYIELKVILQSMQVNLTEIDYIKE